MNNPVVSIVMPVYNGERFLGESIESMLGQRFKDFEFIIVDDASKDNSWSILESYAKKDIRIKLFQNPTNIGIAANRNFGLGKARGKYIAVMDQDDISENTRIEKQVEFLEKQTEYAAIGTQCTLIDESSKVVGERHYSTDWSQLKKTLLDKSPLCNPSSMIRKRVFDEIGLYDEEYSGSEEYDFWIRSVLAGYKVGNLNEYLLRYRVSVGQTKVKNIKKILLNTQKIQLKYLRKFPLDKLSPILIIKHALRYALFLMPSQYIYKIFSYRNYKSCARSSTAANAIIPPCYKH